MYHPICFASCICSLGNSAYASIQAFPNIFPATVISGSPWNLSDTLLRYCALLLRLLSFSCLTIDKSSHLSSFMLYEVSFAGQRSGRTFLFRLDFALRLPLQGLLKTHFCHHPIPTFFASRHHHAVKAIEAFLHKAWTMQGPYSNIGVP